MLWVHSWAQSFLDSSSRKALALFDLRHRISALQLIWQVSFFPFSRIYHTLLIGSIFSSASLVTFHNRSGAWLGPRSPLTTYMPGQHLRSASSRQEVTQLHQEREQRLTDYKDRFYLVPIRIPRAKAWATLPLTWVFNKDVCHFLPRVAKATSNSSLGKVAFDMGLHERCLPLLAKSQ